jgi:hypothetical protein
MDASSMPIPLESIALDPAVRDNIASLRKQVVDVERAMSEHIKECLTKILSDDEIADATERMDACAENRRVYDAVNQQLLDALTASLKKRLEAVAETRTIIAEIGTGISTS